MCSPLHWVILINVILSVSIRPSSWLEVFLRLLKRPHLLSLHTADQLSSLWLSEHKCFEPPCSWESTYSWPSHGLASFHLNFSRNGTDFLWMVSGHGVCVAVGVVTLGHCEVEGVVELLVMFWSAKPWPWPWPSPVKGKDTEIIYFHDNVGIPQSCLKHLKYQI